MALTFGTLLSSQGADAQELHPRGLHPWLEVQLYAGFQKPTTRGVWSGSPSGPRGAERTLHVLRSPLQGGPEPVLLGPTWSTTTRVRDPFRASLRTTSPATYRAPRGPVLSDTLHNAAPRRGLPRRRARRVTPWVRATRGQATPAGRNWTLTRGPTGFVVLGMQCSQVRWHEPPMTTRSP